MNELKIFEREEFGQVRVVERDCEPWFVAKDICTILEIQNTSDALTALDADEKSTIGNSYSMNDTSGLRSDSALISESGMYALIMRSRKPEAKKFRKWVTSEVLPSIRKTGTYGSTQALPQSYADALRALAQEVEQKELAINERDYAIATKAEIGSRREATSMQTASLAVKQRDKALNELGEGKTWKTAKAIPWIKEFFNVNNKAVYNVVGRHLSRLSRENGYDVRRLQTSEYPQGVGIYHVDVIEELYQSLCEDDSLFSKYRIDCA